VVGSVRDFLCCLCHGSSRCVGGGAFLVGPARCSSTARPARFPGGAGLSQPGEAAPPGKRSKSGGRGRPGARRSAARGMTGSKGGGGGGVGGAWQAPCKRSERRGGPGRRPPGGGGRAAPPARGRGEPR